ncbi:MAG: hypothetical protein LQ345_006013 [Seirophora villosa]|nr:MAG: hypothetical protein LQ345_006013 [Seirophora villosa]
MAEETTLQLQNEIPAPSPVPVDPPPPTPQQSDPFLPQPSVDSPAPPLTNIHADIDMADAAPSPAVAQSAATPTAQRTATPSRNTNGIIEAPPPLPVKAAAHGAPARRYLNEKVTGVLLEGMKKLAVEQPEDPLRVLGEYLLQRSKEVESS